MLTPSLLLLFLNLFIAFAAEEGFCENNNPLIDCTTNSPSWKTWTVDEFWSKLDCENVFREGPRPIHNASTWMLLRGMYHGIVGPVESTIGPPITHEHGFFFQVEIRQNEKGRSVFAAESIPEGSLIWNTRNTARFRNGAHYRQLLASVDTDISCDIIQWAYVQEKDELLFVSVDLDPGILINSGTSIFKSDGLTKRKKRDNVQNMGCDRKAASRFPGGCTENYFALRDIDKGEELLLDYGDFAITHGWENFGL
mmetsp:Transcript_31489/g.47602  ORF Transcript_31489/g.47602 Transcript_31489/m.47602 type:complete len:254 (-) Transcript_31489:345-1106(-)